MSHDVFGWTQISYLLSYCTVISMGAERMGSFRAVRLSKSNRFASSKGTLPKQFAIDIFCKWFKSRGCGKSHEVFWIIGKEVCQLIQYPIERIYALSAVECCMTYLAWLQVLSYLSSAGGTSQPALENQRRLIVLSVSNRFASQRVEGYIAWAVCIWQVFSNPEWDFNLITWNRRSRLHSFAKALFWEIGLKIDN